MNEKGWALASYVLVGTILLCAAGYVARMNGLSASDLASWVQAVGSIAAIIGSFFLGEQQYRKRLRQSELAQARKVAEGVYVVFAAAKEAMDALRAFVRQAETAELVDGKLSVSSVRLRASMEVLRSLLALTLPGPTIHALVGMLKCQSQLLDFAAEYDQGRHVKDSSDRQLGGVIGEADAWLTVIRIDMETYCTVQSEMEK